jgi:hypothetical protein
MPMTQTARERSQGISSRPGPSADQRSALSATPPGALERRPRSLSGEEQEFVAIGPAAEKWLITAAAGMSGNAVAGGARSYAVATRMTWRTS